MIEAITGRYMQLEIEGVLQRLYFEESHTVQELQWLLDIDIYNRTFASIQI